MESALPQSVLAALFAQARLGGENYSRVPLVAGEHLVADLLGFGEEHQVYTHRHLDAEHLLYVVEGQGEIQIGPQIHLVQAGDVLVVARGAYHRIRNPTVARLLVLQVSSPKPWDARHGGPHPPQVQSPAE